MSEGSMSRAASEDMRIRDDALRWAGSFKEPQSGNYAAYPRRRVIGKQRKANVPASRTRARRLSKFYNNYYREILNLEISLASRKSIDEGYAHFVGSLVGSSQWSAREKQEFFKALPSMGKKNTQAIATRISSKSEVEVREYIQLLDRSCMKHHFLDHRPRFSFTDVPIAFEIGEECCSALERAGDAIAARQDSVEDEAERAKRGEQWLLTEKIAKNIGPRMIEQRIELSVTPAIKLFHLETWLALSKNVFMNAAAPRADENWRALCEPGESPAIRSTAFEDFYSLAVAVTKRLVSAALYCGTSRQREMGLSSVNMAKVNIADVEAAISIVGLERNYQAFWARCPRKCGVQVCHEGAFSVGDCVVLNYRNVERILGGPTMLSSRSRQSSQSHHSTRFANSTQDFIISALEPQSDHDSVSERSSQSSLDLGNKSDDKFDMNEDETWSFFNQDIMDHDISRGRKKVGAPVCEEADLRLDRVIETYDAAVSRREEQRLCAIFQRQTKPSTIQDSLENDLKQSEAAITPICDPKY